MQQIAIRSRAGSTVSAVLVESDRGAIRLESRNHMEVCALYGSASTSVTLLAMTTLINSASRNRRHGAG